MDLNTVGKWREKYITELKGIYPEGESRFIFRIVLEDILKLRGKSPDFKLSSEEAEKLEGALSRLCRHEPVQYITGKAYFFGHFFRVDPRVLIPRSETEELVDLILNKEPVGQLDLIDIGTGSGCIAISLALERPAWNVSATDVSVEALRLAAENGEILDAHVQWIADDILRYESRKFGKYDVVVSNPPYVPYAYANLMERNVHDFEPHTALFVENDNPLQFYRAIERFCHQHLKPGGSLYMEINSKYSKELVNYFRLKDYSNIRLDSDISGKKRMLHVQMR